MSPSRWPLIFLCAAFAVTAPLLAQSEAERSAEDIVREFRRVRTPSRSDGNSPEARARFKLAIENACRRRARLAWELYQRFPDHPEAAKMLGIRWAGMTNALGEGRKVIDEVNAVLRGDPDRAVCREAACAAARAAKILKLPGKTQLAFVESFIRLAPEDDRCGPQLLGIAKYETSSPATMRALCKRILKLWPQNRWSAGPAKSLLKRLDGIGKPFDRSAIDLRSGRELKFSAPGKLRLVHLFSLKVERSAGQIEELRAFARRHPEVALCGVQSWRFEGGAKAVLERANALGASWPIAYPEKSFKTPWSGPWAAGEVPLYFLVDQSGHLATLGHRLARIEEYLTRTRR